MINSGSYIICTIIIIAIIILLCLYVYSNFVVQIKGMFP